MWRYLPDYTTREGKINWFGKGHGEESVTLPFAFQKALSEVTDQRVLKVQNPDLVFAGTSRKAWRESDLKTYYKEVDAHPVKLNGDIYPEGHDKIPPSEVGLGPNGQEPDFKRVVASWTESNLVDNRMIKINVFASQDGNFRYAFLTDGKGRSWIGGIENNSPIGSTALRKDWVLGGDLTTPSIEYFIQSGGYGTPDPEIIPYVDMYPRYVSKIPIIQDYERKVLHRPPQESKQ